MRKHVRTGKTVRMLNTVGSRLLWLRSMCECGSARKVGELIGVGDYLSKLEAHHNGAISPAILEKLCSFYGVTADWLLLGKGKDPTQEDILAAVKKAKRRAAA